MVIALAALGRCTHNADNSQSGMKVSDKFVRDHKVNQEDAAAKREELRYIDQVPARSVVHSSSETLQSVEEGEKRSGSGTQGGHQE